MCFIAPFVISHSISSTMDAVHQVGFRYFNLSMNFEFIFNAKRYVIVIVM